MPKAKAILMAFVVALALCAFASAPAFAEEKMSWFVKGTQLASGATVALAATAAVDESTIINSPSLGLRISCSGHKTTKGELQGGEEMSQSESDAFEGCSEISPSTCKISSTTIQTPPLLRLLRLIIGALGFHLVRLVLHPRSGKVLSEIDFTGTCSFAGEQAFDGEITAAAPTLTSEAAVQAVENLGTTENNSLELDGKKVYIEGGKTLLKLASGLPWSFQPEA